MVEPFVPHEQNEEYYLCIYAQRNADVILFHHEGGVDVGDVDSKAARLEVAVDGHPDPADIKKLIAAMQNDADRRLE